MNYGAKAYQMWNCWQYLLILVEKASSIDIANELIKVIILLEI